eukprot:TRINITY_DN3647_c0_g1_i1.p1 TRINITY_DN3647_c0_g1~~TRINITY_DN3647_c0_g1_i1.p1  ORF type:complete len:520 (+),score=92.53 TRINITY_DN3647_c0_g1_i1:143-1561(+)
MAKVAPSNGDDNLKDVPTQLPHKAEAENLSQPEAKNITSKAFSMKDAEDIKNRVRSSLLQKDKYDVANDYRDSGIIQRIARSKPFENATLIVIATNALWIAIDTDWNPAATLLDAHIVFFVAENIFCVYFTVEILVRFCAFKHKRKCLNSGWFVFDSVLVFFMVLETWVFLALFSGSSPFGDQTAILRLFRLLRLSRLLKMLKSFPQLMILVKGMKEAMAGVVYVLLLLVVFTYVFAIICTQLSADNIGIHAKYFDNVALSMYSLIIYATFLDALSDFLDAIRAENQIIFVIIWAYIGLSALTVMNMLIGVLCELISAVAETEKEIIITDNVNAEMRNVLRDIDEDDNGTISVMEMRQMMVMPAAIAALDHVGVDPVGMMDFAEAFFLDEKGQPTEKSFEEFMGMVLDLRASNGATLKDIQNLVKQVNHRFAANQKAFESRIEALEGELRESTRRIEDVLEAVACKIQNIKM